MAIAERITRYTVWVGQTDRTGQGDPYLDYSRSITLELESGTYVYIYFPVIRPDDWLQFPQPDVINIYMTADQYDDVYHILQTENPAFCTALQFEGLEVGSVHTEFYHFPVPPIRPPVPPAQSLEAMIMRAQGQAPAAAPEG